MKKILIIPLLFLLVVITQSCQKKIKACEGMVEEVKGSTSMVVVIGDDGVKFDINDAILMAPLWLATQSRWNM